MRRPPAWTAVAICLGIGLLAGVLSRPADAGDRFKVRTIKIARGVTLKKITDSVGPNRLRLVTLDPPATDASIDTALAGPSFPSYAKPSSIGKRRRALVAINGDFAAGGRPVHPHARDGDLDTAGIRNGANFAVSLDESLSKIGVPDRMVRLRVRAAADPEIRGAVWTARRWNSGNPTRFQLAGYTAVGGSVEYPRNGKCSARLKPTSRRAFTTSGIVRRYEVVGRGVCRVSSLAPPEGNEVVISARRWTALGRAVDALVRGDRLRVSWTLGPGWSGITDTIGGVPLLVRPNAEGDPVNVAPPPSAACGYFCSRNPRTGIGVRADGTVLLMVVDGRRPSWSVGMTLVQFAQAFIRNGAVWAVNLDGGGGTVMWVRRLGIVNKPSQSYGERVAVSAVLVLPGDDPGEPASLAPASLAPATEGSDLVGDDGWPWSPLPGGNWDADEDPGSTGGLLDAIEGDGL